MGTMKLPGNGLQRLTAQQPSNGRQLASGGVATLRPGRARGGAGIRVLGACPRPLGLVAANLIPIGSSPAWWRLPRPVSSNRPAPQQSRIDELMPWHWAPTKNS